MLVLVLASTSNSFVCARAKPFNSTIANGTKLILLVLIVLVLLVLLVLLLIVLVLDNVVLLKKMATKSDFRFLIRPTFYIGPGGFAFATRGGVCGA